jgi:hypothetical protein
MSLAFVKNPATGHSWPNWQGFLKLPKVINLKKAGTADLPIEQQALAAKMCGTLK